MAWPNPRLAKLNRSYTVDELAGLYGVHRNTVRAWFKAGLPAIDDHRPMMFQGRALRVFLQARRDRAKRPCQPGTLYCCKCRAPREPAPGSAVFDARATGAGTLRALCVTCGCRMFRRTRQSSLADIMPQIPVRIVEAVLHIEERPTPSAIRA
ncbi:helix-turn-helix domain-containing protein [Brevundimonas sp.]|uniref:helix-turn-helix domain-containing protein n=1 Tax=Brevundimonas sp. TaxID=1871086 RepID=UPI002EDB6145